MIGTRISFNPAEAEEGFSRRYRDSTDNTEKSFNPAEAEEGFSSPTKHLRDSMISIVSIQPKPKKGLVGVGHLQCTTLKECFNPAEAEEGFSSV